jgi:flavin-dependent dehydrogenase
MKTAVNFPDEGHVVIIGGGPGGTACALALHRLAREMGRKIKITVVEGKQFSQEQHYNQCVGVLSPPLPQLLEKDLDVPFPHHLSCGMIKRYILHTERETITLNDEHHSTVLRRIEYDAYMMETVKQRGIDILPARAVDLEFHEDNVVVYTENVPLEADVVVGAFGLDEGSASMFSRQSAYRPPQTLDSIVTNYHPGPTNMEEFGPAIHAFLPANPQIEFGGITPKDNHLTINIAGRVVDTNLMRKFISHPMVRQALPGIDSAGTYNPRDLSFFKGRFPCSLGKNIYGDRYVIVGDAAGLVRAFKGKGINSAVKSGIRAAETILKVGVSRDAFGDHYWTANQDIIQDLPYGKVFRRLTILLSRLRLLDPVLRAAQQNDQLQIALFDAVSAHAPYRRVLGRSIQPRTLWSIVRSIFKRTL